MNHQDNPLNSSSHISYYNNKIRPRSQVLLTWNSLCVSLNEFCTIRFISIEIYIAYIHALVSHHSHTLSHLYFFLKTTPTTQKSFAILLGIKKRYIGLDLIRITFGLYFERNTSCVPSILARFSTT